MIDFTKMKVGTKYGHLVVARCPKCRRNGRKTTYHGGDVAYLHKAEGNEAMIYWREHCYIQAKRKE